MRFSILLILFVLGFNCNNFPQIVINEVQTSNKSTISDEDGDFEDWIELYNAGVSAVNLYQYGLSDDQSEPFKWRFPSVILEPKGQLLVFASGKNRKPPVNHWETAVFAQDIWHYFIGRQNPQANWNKNAFDASGWLEGPGGIGYGDSDDGTVIAPAISVYMLKTFVIPDVSAIESSILSMDYDDGFVAYLNGTEIARANIVGTPPLYDKLTVSDHEAQMYLGGTPDNFVIDPAILKSLLVNGNNVLAIETHNSSASSTDLSSSPFLSFGIRSGAVFFKPVPVWFSKNLSSNLHTNFKLKHSVESIILTEPSGSVIDKLLVLYSDLNHSQCRIPDGSPDWCISTAASPAKTNNSSLCYKAYTERPAFDIAPGFYKQGQLLSLIGSNPGSKIHYSLNGNIPKLTDPLYKDPIHVNSTQVVRARSFGPEGFLPGKISTATYIIGSHNYDLPVVSVTTDSSNLWDYYSGMYVLGPNAKPDFPYFDANFWQPWEKDCHVEYFGPMESRKFELDAGLSIHGGWTRALDQKSFDIKTHSYYDGSSISYKLFGDKPITEFKSFVLRNAGNDWMITHMRDALMQRVMKNTFVDYIAYSPSVVYLNGKYWGIYNIRERNDKDYVEENHGIDADSVDVIENDGIASCGDSDAFWQMVQYITTHEMSVPENFEVASSMWNMPNYADYFIAETYYVNNDWIGDWTNNIKLWRQHKPGSKWNYMLWDTDFGLGYGGSYGDNKLAGAMNPLTATPHAAIFSGMLKNDEFKKYFINRYADLINTVYQPVYMKTMIQEMQDTLAYEMSFAWQRWFGNSGGLTWLNNINAMKTFINNRPNYARQHINTVFNLQGLVAVSLATSPQGSGEIKINTIVPGPLPWTGTYFNGNPVTLTAIARHGYKFLYWQANTYIGEDVNQTLSVDLNHFDTFTAVFSGNPEKASVTISEVNYHSDSTWNSGDWLEVYNYGSNPLDISDWHISDSKLINDYIFPTGALLPAYGHMVVAEDTSLFKASYPGINCYGPLGFGLSNKKETVSLLDIQRANIASFTYYDSIPWFEAADGLGRTLELHTGASDLNDPANWFAGCMGGSPGQSYQPCEDNVVFSEINYNSDVSADAGDWVELFNPGTNAFDISGWKFSDSDNLHLFPIPPGTVIPAAGYMVLYGDKLKFESSFPSVSNKSGPFVFGLSGSGEAIRLFDTTGKLQFSVVYNDDPPWPKDPDGNGYTLELADAHGIMCNGLNWFAGCKGGSPGKPYLFPCNLGLDEPGISSFAIYPNPAKTQLFILSKNNNIENADIRICDALGRTVLIKQITLNGSSSAQLSLDGINNGIYFMKITTGSNQLPLVVRIFVAK